MRKRSLWIVTAALVCSIGVTACNKQNQQQEIPAAEAAAPNEEAAEPETNTEINTDQAYIETLLNLSNNESQAWTYDAEADAWIMSVVQAVAYPELPDQQGGIGLCAGCLCHGD